MEESRAREHSLHSLIVFYLLEAAFHPFHHSSDLNLLKLPAFSILLLTVSNTHDIWHVLLFLWLETLRFLASSTV